MIVLIAGVLSITLWFVTTIKAPVGKHAPPGAARKDPSFFKVIWFFLSIVAILAGYVLMVTG